MKLLKKLLVGAAVAAAAISMMSCNWSLPSMFQDAFGVADLFKYDDVNVNNSQYGYGSWLIDETNNEATKWMRGGKLLMTKHSDMSGKVTLADAKGSGPLGVLFNVTKKDGKYSFGVAAVLEKADGTMQYYVSYFANIDEDEMGYYNFGAATPIDPANTDKSTWTPGNTELGIVRNANAKTLTAVDPEETEPYEIMYVDISDFPKGNFDVDGKKVVMIDVKEDDEGGYNINFYEEGQYKDYYPKTGEEPKANFHISGESLNKTGPGQKKVGVYANIYPTRTLKGSVEIIDLTRDAVIAD